MRGRLAAPLGLGALWLVLQCGGCGGGAPGGGDAGSAPGSAPQPSPPWTGGRGPSGADYVLPPDRVHYGGSYADWSALWWAWALEQPRATSPLMDATGAYGTQGQVDPVWFLAGVFYPGTTESSVSREISVPRGISLFFPVAETESDNQACFGPDTNFPFIELSRQAAQTMQQVQGLLCEIDGARVIDAPNLLGAEKYRAQSAEFSAWLPVDNILGAECGTPPPTGLVGPIASDGVWMMLAPMPVGVHTIHFRSTLPAYTQDVTYRVTVLP